MKTRDVALTRAERNVVIMATQHPNGMHLSNCEIGQRLGLPPSRVKTLLHQACVKLGARNRNEAILFAIDRGDVSLTEYQAVDELAEILSTLDPAVLRRVAHLLREQQGHGLPSAKDERIMCTHMAQARILSAMERDVLIHSQRGLTPEETADRLCICASSVRTFLKRAIVKLGAHKRADAILVALKRGEIGIGEIASFSELLHRLAPFGADSIDKIAQLLDERLGREPISTGS